MDSRILDHASEPDAHHTPPAPYVLPAAAAGVRGGVEAVTNDIIDTGTSTGVFGWMISHVKRVVNAIVPAWATDDNTPIPVGKLTNAPAGGGDPEKIWQYVPQDTDTGLDLLGQRFEANGEGDEQTLLRALTAADNGKFLVAELKRGVDISALLIVSYGSRVSNAGSLTSTLGLVVHPGADNDEAMRLRSGSAADKVTFRAILNHPASGYIATLWLKGAP